MGNVASLELSKKLYELSGWGDYGNDPIEKWLDYTDDWSVPAYDCGYLLRKLPKFCRVWLRDESPLWIATHGAGGSEHGTTAYMDTPEDALCKLAIKLFEERVLNDG